MNRSVVNASAHHSGHLAHRPDAPLPRLAAEKFLRGRGIAPATPAFSRAAGHCATPAPGTTHRCEG